MRILVIMAALSFISINIMSQTENKIDYSKSKNWSKKCDVINNEIDLFFIHPTTYGPPSNGLYNADINNEKLNRYTDISAVERMAAAFSDNCNVFAPRYRQVNIEVLAMPEKDQEKYLAMPTNDVKEAFIYYLENLNNGRPFIIASHSQGSNVMQNVLFNNPNIFDKEKLVAAYMPGWTFTDEIIAKLGIPLGESPTQTGCILTWNTVGPNGTSPTLSEGGRCVNPLSWSTDKTNHPASENSGAIIYIEKDGSNIEVPNFTSAKINEIGGLEIPTPNADIYEKLDMPMGKECYHKYDYDFFFNNIKDNVALRCKTYLKNRK